MFLYVLCTSGVISQAIRVCCKSLYSLRVWKRAQCYSSNVNALFIFHWFPLCVYSKWPCHLVVTQPQVFLNMGYAYRDVHTHHPLSWKINAFKCLFFFLVWTEMYKLTDHNHCCKVRTFSDPCVLLNRFGRWSFHSVQLCTSYSKACSF